MKYFIGHLIKGEAKKYQEKLISEISSNFCIRSLNGFVPAHFTVKAPFESYDVSPIEELLGEVCGRGKVSDVKIDGIGNFHKRIIYLNGRSSSGVVKFIDGLNDELRKIGWMQFGKYDLIEDNLHGTLARVKDNKQFDDVMGFLANERPYFEFGFDNISIFQKRKNGWEVYKEFKLGDAFVPSGKSKPL